MFKKWIYKSSIVILTIILFNFLKEIIIKLKKHLLIILSSIVFLSSAYAQSNLTQYKSSPASSDEELKIMNNPKNQNDVELIIFILKSMQDKSITNILVKLIMIT